MEPGAVNPPHRHVASEQIWVALEGNGIRLLDHERTEPFSAGDVVRFADGDLHGFRNPDDVPLFLDQPSSIYTKWRRCLGFPARASRAAGSPAALTAASSAGGLFLTVA